jgi:putative spermidine/putrescine transport system permease protein
LRRALLVAYLVLFSMPMLGLWWFTLHSGPSFTLANYATEFADATFYAALVRSLVVSAVAALLTVALFAPTVYLVLLVFPNLIGAIEWMSFLPFAIPGVSLAIGYVTVFSSGPISLVGTPYLLPFAFSVIALPFFLRSYVNSLLGVGARELTDAALTLGANLLQAFVQIVLPNAISGLSIGAFLVFALGMGEFAITQLTTGGTYLTFPIYMQAYFLTNPLQGATMAALGFVITFLAVAVGTFLVPGLARVVRGHGQQASS